jgi:hypothetical protein
MREIKLTSGKVAFIDDEDFERVSQYKWHAYRNGNSWYAARSVVIDGRRRSQHLHSFLLNTPKGMKTDHKNGDGLNNTRANIRISSHAQNMRNLRRHRANASGYKGVYLDKGSGRYRAKICFNGMVYRLGTYDSPEEAAKVYDARALEFHGEFAWLNFPDQAARESKGVK